MNEKEQPKNIRKVIKRTVEPQQKSKEGVLKGKDGKTIYDDYWLHQDVMEEDNKNK